MTAFMPPLAAAIQQAITLPPMTPPLVIPPLGTPAAGVPASPPPAAEAAPVVPAHLAKSFAKLDAIFKAGGDPKKIIAAIQAMRNEAELAGDLDAAKDFTDAICLIQQATGASEGGPDTPDESSANSDQPPADVPATPPPDQAAPPPPDQTQAAAQGYAMAALPTDLAKLTTDLSKAGKTFSSANADAMHKAIQALASKLAAAGDATAMKVMAAYGTVANDQPPVPPAADALGQAALKSDSLSSYVTTGLLIQKAMQPMLDQLTAKNVLVDQLIAALTRTPAPGGPALRGVDKFLPSQALAKVAAGENFSVDEAIAMLQKVHDESNDVYAKQQLRVKIAELQMKKGRGMV